LLFGHLTLFWDLQKQNVSIRYGVCAKGTDSIFANTGILEKKNTI